MTSVITNAAWPKPPRILGAVSKIKKRAQHSGSLASAISFCAKGSLNHHNQHFGEDYASIKTVATPGPYQNCMLLGVADGVGGWRRHNVDPSRLSRGILQTMSAQFDSSATHLLATKNYPTELVASAFNQLRENRDSYAGGTTLCFALFNPQTSLLKVTNIGDSAALLFRNGEIAHETTTGAEGMTPHQLTILPAYMHACASDFEEDASLRHDIVTEDWELKPQDILVIASDGLFDNLPACDIAAVVQEAQTVPNQSDAELVDRIANQLVTQAYRNSRDPHYWSPFARKYAKFSGSVAYMGGKPDDITVVVSVLSLDEEVLAHL